MDATERRLRPKRRVVALEGRTEAVAVVRAAVAREGVLTTTVDGNEVVVFHRPGQASALHTPTIAKGRRIGSVAAYRPVVNGQHLDFVATSNGFTDRQTHSRWNILGDATHGPLAGQSLRPYPYVDTFWFAWVAFQPDTRIVPGWR